MSVIRPDSPAPDGPPGGGLTLVHSVNAAWNALTYVYDPELYLDVVSLGLVYDVRDEDGTIVVEMTLTTPGCPASESLPEMARAAVAEAVGDDVTAVDVRVVRDPPWSPAMIDNAAAEALGFRIR
jgi:metal-sulfur cluster biosynthetic enzyme